jgi:hypothetical protein
LSLSEKVLSRFLDNHELLPPFRVIFNFDALCTQIGHEDPETVEALYAMIKGITAWMPDGYKITEAELKEHVDARSDKSTMTIPLHEVMNVSGSLASILFYFVYEIKSDEHYPLRKQLMENENRYHKVSMYERRKKFIPPPTQVKEEPVALINIYLKGTPFYDFFMYTQVPFRIPRKTFASHGIILAPPNHGKTQLLGSLVAGFLNETQPVGCFVLDPHGDLFNTLRTRVDSSRLVCLDPDTSPPPLNFLDFGNSTEAQTLQTFSYLMSSLSGGMSDKQGAIVPYLLKLLKRIPGASLETLRLIVDEKVKGAVQSQFASVIASLPDVDQGFFHNQFYSSRMQETKDAIGWKLYAALSNETFRKMFSARTNSFDAWKAMQERKVVLVKGSENTLGEAGAPIFLQFIVAQAMQASFRRAALPNDEEHRPLCLLIIDEAKHVFNDQTERILTECRKWNLGFLAATQLISQIPENVRTAIYGATAIKISGPVASNDATQLAREMYATPDFIRGMKAKERQGAHWAFYVTGLTDKAADVYVPYGSLETLPVINPHGQGMTFESYEEEDEEDPYEGIYLETHEGPSKPEPSRGYANIPAEADTTTLSQHEDGHIIHQPVQKAPKMDTSQSPDEPLTSKKKW